MAAPQALTVRQGTCRGREPVPDVDPARSQPQTPHPGGRTQLPYLPYHPRANRVHS
jgi:hypothetical protein